MKRSAESQGSISGGTFTKGNLEKGSYEKDFKIKQVFKISISPVTAKNKMAVKKRKHC